MISLIIVVVVMACASWMAWSRWHYWRTPIGPLPSAEVSPQTRAFEAFTHGNTCVAAGRFADATAAFEQAREACAAWPSSSSSSGWSRGKASQP
jgi:hypothetical protein